MILSAIAKKLKRRSKDDFNSPLTKSGFVDSV